MPRANRRQQQFDVRAALGEYESTVGQRTGRLAVTIDQGQISKLGFTAKCMKFFLIGLNVFFFFAGITFMAVGQYMKNNTDAGSLFGSSLLSAILAMGAFMLIVGVIGLIGARTETRLFLYIYAGLLGCLFFVLLIAGAYVVSQADTDGVYTLVYRLWLTLTTPDKTALQNAYTCCGANYYCDEGDPKTNNCPTCPLANGQGPVVQAAQRPCIPLIVKDLKQYYVSFGVLGIVLAVLTLGGVLGAFCLMGGIVKSKEAEAELKRKQRRGEVDGGGSSSGGGSGSSKADTRSSSTGRSGRRARSDPADEL